MRSSSQLTLTPIQIFQINSFFVFIKFFRGSSSFKNYLDPNFFKIFFKLYIFFKLQKNTTFFFFYFRRTDGRTDGHHGGSMVSSIIYRIIKNNLNIIHEELEPTYPYPYPKIDFTLL
jgi:hypothetical protein